MKVFGKFTHVGKKVINYANGDTREVLEARFVVGEDEYCFDIWSNPDYVTRNLIAPNSAGDLTLEMKVNTWTDRNGQRRNQQDAKFKGFHPSVARQMSAGEAIANAVEERRAQAVAMPQNAPQEAQQPQAEEGEMGDGDKLPF